jgi:hypothetical protein
MSLLLVAAVIAAPLPAVARPSSFTPPTSHCPRTTTYYAWRNGKALKPQKLNELPPANAYNAVYRLVGGCESPVIVRYGLGNR